MCVTISIDPCVVLVVGVVCLRYGTICHRVMQPRFIVCTLCGIALKLQAGGHHSVFPATAQGIAIFIGGMLVPIIPDHPL